MVKGDSAVHAEELDVEGGAAREPLLIAGCVEGEHKLLRLPCDLKAGKIV